MKILVLSQLVPYPPDSGPKIKLFYFLQWMAREHDVTLVSFARSPAEVAAAEQLKGLCRAVYTVPLQRSRARDVSALNQSFMSGEPFVMVRDRSEAMLKLVRELAAREPFDLVHADQLNMAQFAFALDGMPVVLDLHNAVWQIIDRLAKQAHGPRRWLLRIERERLRRYEGWACRKASRTIAVSEVDRAALREVAGDVPIDIVPIAIDAAGQQPVKRDSTANAALSVATMFWPPNVDGVQWFGRDVYPRVRQHIDAPFYVVGARPARSVQALAKRQPGMVVTGYVEDLAPYHRQTAAFIVPLRSGSGMRVKILEAFALGLPVVSTTIGYEGIDAQPGEHLIAGDTATTSADGVLDLVRDRDLGERTAEAARQLVLDRYDWRVVCPALNTTYRQALAE